MQKLKSFLPNINFCENLHQNSIILNFCEMLKLNQRELCVYFDILKKFQAKLSF